MANQNHKVLLVAAVPPPFHGRNVANQFILDAWPQESPMRLIHFNTADERPIDTLGKLDLTNLFLAVKYWALLVWYLIKERPDTVHIPVGQNIWAFLKDSGFLMIAKLFRTKQVIHLHGGHFRRFFEGTSPLLQWWIRFALSGISRAIVLGNVFVPIFEGLVPSDRIEVIPYGIDGKRFSARAGQVVRDKSIRVLYFSNWIKEKGFLDLIRSIPLVLAELSEVSFVFAGAPVSEADKKEAIALVKKHQLQDVVEFRGLTVDEAKIELFCQSDLFVLPTYYPYEGQPLVLLEAMAAGLPIITTDQGAIAETVIHNQTGLIIPKMNPKAISEAIVTLAKNYDLRRRFEIAARQRFENEYSVERYISRITSLHTEVISEV